MSESKDQQQFHLNSKFENIFAILQWPKDDLLRFGRVWKILSFGFFCSFQRFEDFKVRALQLLRGFLKISELDFVWVFELPEAEACLFLGLMLVWLRPAGSFLIITRILKTRILKGFGLSQGLLAISSTVASLVWVLSFLWERMPRPAFWLHPHIELPTGRSGPHSRISIRDQVFFSADDYRSSTYGLGRTMDQWSAIHRVHIRWTLWLLTNHLSSHTVVLLLWFWNQYIYLDQG